jgi:hypothetical protein
MRILKPLTTLILLAGLILFPIVALGSDISTATYTGNIVVTNNGTATTNVATTMTLSSSDMISQNWVDSNFTRIAVRNASGADVPFMPAASTWCLWVPSISANLSQLNYTMYTGPSSMNSTKHYFPGTSGMNTIDSATLEPSDNFTALWNGFVDTALGTSKNIINKSGAFRTYISGAGNITAGIYGAPGYLIPTSASGWTSSDLARDNNTATHAVFDTLANAWSDNITLNFSTPIITSSARYYKNENAGNFSLIVIDLYNGTWTTVYSGDDGADSAWITKTFAEMSNVTSARIKVYHDAVGTVEYSLAEFQPYGTLDTPAKSVTAVGVTSAEHLINVTADSTNLTISIDGILKDSIALAGASVPDNANDWVSFQNNAMPYVEYQKIYIGGVLRQYVDWNYNAAGPYTFNDDSGFGNIGIPTFRTASSSAYVSAALTTFAPIATAEAPLYTVGSGSAFVTGNITASSGFSSANVTGSHFPGSDVVDAIAVGSDTPNSWIWGILGLLIIISSGLFISWMERTSGSGSGTLLLRLGIGVAVLGLMVTLGKFDFWMLVIYLFIALAPALASRQYDLGASPSELSFIGFLSTTWVGLTIVNRVLEGQILAVADKASLNTVMFTQSMTVLGLFFLRWERPDNPVYAVWLDLGNGFHSLRYGDRIAE